MTPTRTFNQYHLGDNLIHLNFLRRIAKDNPDRHFVHYAQWQYLEQLREVVEDVPNIELAEFGYMTPTDSIDAWRGAGGFWYSHPNRNDFVRFHVESWFPHLAEKMKVENPVRSAKDMLFDYPNILQSLNGKFEIPFDVLVINSSPGSGQFVGFDHYALGNIAARLAANGLKTVTTGNPGVYGQNLASTHLAGLSVTGIGHLSLHCHTILMVSTGPSWTTFNIWNIETIRNRIILIDSERVMIDQKAVHCRSVGEAEAVLNSLGLL